MENQGFGMKKTLTLIILYLFGFGASAMAQEKASGAEDEDPLKITIRPDYQIFDGNFIGGEGIFAPRIETLGVCPREQILSCDITSRFWGEVNKTSEVIAAYAYEKQKAEWRSPSLALLMGRRYAGTPDYLILASFGIDPGLKPLNPWPQPDGRMYGSLWFADTLSLADRMAGPIMLTKGGPTQTELLNGDRRIFSGF